VDKLLFEKSSELLQKLTSIKSPLQPKNAT